MMSKVRVPVESIDNKIVFSFNGKCKVSFNLLALISGTNWVIPIRIPENNGKYIYKPP
jgi:hypothetical protein